MGRLPDRRTSRHDGNQASIAIAAFEPDHWAEVVAGAPENTPFPSGSILKRRRVNLPASSRGSA